MAVNLDYYYDNNETIYASEHFLFQNQAMGTNNQITLGLQDLTDLSGQSTIFVNKIKFKVRGSGIADSGTGTYCYGLMTAGIIPADLINTDFELMQTYQDYRAWPIKLGKDFFYQRVDSVSNTQPMATGFSMSLTYTPRKALLLNREQLIALCVTPEYGVNTQFIASIYLQAKRGD